MLERNVVLVLRTRQERTERRLRHKKEANPPPMEPPPRLLNNNYLYIDLNMNFGANRKQEAVAAVKKVGELLREERRDSLGEREALSSLEVGFLSLGNCGIDVLDFILFVLECWAVEWSC
ncbi:hypothetical protein KM043_001139 [Ampulex compressa]|nr:hypothetical protein KM043_001139 [Ampulex compressa]